MSKRMFRTSAGMLFAATAMSCAPAPSSPDSAASKNQQVLADFANAVDSRLRQSPDYAGFHTEAGMAVFLFVRDGEASLAKATSDPRAVARDAEFSLAQLRAAREAVEADFARSKVPFRLITTDYRRNRVVVDGVARGPWEAALARREISKRPEAAYFFGN